MKSENHRKSVCHHHKISRTRRSVFLRKRKRNLYTQFLLNLSLSYLGLILYSLYIASLNETNKYCAHCAMFHRHVGLFTLRLYIWVKASVRSWFIFSLFPYDSNTEMKKKYLEGRVPVQRRCQRPSRPVLNWTKISNAFG